MEALRRDDPRRIGPYFVVRRHGKATLVDAEPQHRFIARTPEGDRTVLLRVVLDTTETSEGYRRRFRTEAEQARSFGSVIPRLTPIEDLSAADDPIPWVASPYIPALSLREAVTVYGGPLPELTVRAVGVALAETVRRLHERGVVHAGISPDSVLLTGNGPFLGGFGAVRVAAEDGEDRTRAPGLVADSVAPEQLTGGRPRPPGDVYALGTVLCYAATGGTTAALGELPLGLREVISSCLAPDPIDRPQAAAVLEELVQRATPSRYGSAEAVVPGTVLDAGAGRAEAFLVPGWLPGRVSAALSRQAADVLAAESEEPLWAAEQAAPSVTQPETAGKPESGSATVPPGTGGIGADVAVPVPDEAASPSWPRRRLVLASGAAAAGLAIGATGMWEATGGSGPEPTAAQRFVASRKSKKKVGGVPPTPRWRYEIPGPAPRFPPLICGHVAVFAGGSKLHGVDTRTGRQLWKADVRASGMPWKSHGGHLILVPGSTLAAVDSRTGRVRWHYDRSSPSRHGALSDSAVLAVEGSTVWCTAKVRSGGEEKQAVVAYDVTKPREQWRHHVPAGFSEGHLLTDVLLMTTPSPRNTKSAKDEGRPRKFVALDRRTGKPRWTRAFDGVTSSQVVEASSAGGGQLVVVAGDRFRGYATEDGGKVRWTVHTNGEKERLRPPLGPPLVHGRTAYASDAVRDLYAVDLSAGRVRWQSGEGLPGGWTSKSFLPHMSSSPSGHRLVVADDAGAIAFDAANGTVLWRFLDLPDKAGETRGLRRVTLTDHLAVVISRRTAFALPLD